MTDRLCRFLGLFALHSLLIYCTLHIIRSETKCEIGAFDILSTRQPRVVASSLYKAVFEWRRMLCPRISGAYFREAAMPPYFRVFAMPRISGAYFLHSHLRADCLYTGIGKCYWQSVRIAERQDALHCSPHGLQCSASWGYLQSVSCLYTYSIVSLFLLCPQKT